MGVETHFCAPPGLGTYAVPGSLSWRRWMPERAPVRSVSHAWKAFNKGNP